LLACLERVGGRERPVGARLGFGRLGHGHGPPAREGVERRGVRDPQQPGAEGRLAPEGRQLVERTQEDVLREVVGLLGARDAADDAAHDVLVAGDELAVGVDLATERALHEEGVRIHLPTRTAHPADGLHQLV
jgi:hypothetical protein